MTFPNAGGSVRSPVGNAAQLPHGDLLPAVGAFSFTNQKAAE